MDLILQKNNLMWNQGDLAIVDGLDWIKQQIIIAINTMLGDWLLDGTLGIDVPRGMRDNAFLLNDAKKQISLVVGVVSIKKINMIIEGQNISIFVALKTIYGNIENLVINKDIS